MKDDNVKVMRNGKKVDRQINFERNECKVQQVHYILNRNKTSEIFKDFKSVMDDIDEEDN